MGESIAFVELVEYIEGCVENGTLLFKFSELSPFSCTSKGLKILKRLKDHKTRLKIALLEHYNATLQEQTDRWKKHRTVLVFSIFLAFSMGRHFSVININGICSFNLESLSREP